MSQLADELPRQLREGYDRSKGKGPTFERGQPVVLFGMGGSAIAGDLLCSLSSQWSATPLSMVRSFDLPAWAQKRMRSIFISYSGDTPETIHAYGEAGRRGLERMVVTSGGELLRKAERDGVPSVQIPAGNPPRASLGYLFGALYGLLEPIFPGGERDLLDAVDELNAIAPRMRAKDGWPKLIALAWGQRDLFVYVPERLSPVGRRWKTQAEENAKRLAHFDTVPELLHNAVVAWDFLPREEAGKRLVVLLSGPGDSVSTMNRMDYLSIVLGGMGCPILDVRLSCKRPVAELLEAVWIGDHASLLEAESLKVDPLPVPAIGKMKEHMARIEQGF
jgi:glucose/mannose-6-phosphate isomerase